MAASELPPSSKKSSWIPGVFGLQHLGKDLRHAALRRGAGRSLVAQMIGLADRPPQPQRRAKSLRLRFPVATKRNLINDDDLLGHLEAREPYRQQNREFP